MDGPSLFHPLGPGLVSVHGTAVARAGRGLLIVGPSGAGKSGLAAQLIHAGAMLICDDLVHIAARQDGPELRAPPQGLPLIELRGLGLVGQKLSGPAPLVAILRLEPSTDRLSEAEALPLHGRQVPLLRHPYRFDLAAKISLWMDAA